MHPVVKRLLYAPIILLILFTLTFFIVRLTPGDPFSSEKELDPQVRESLNKRYHLDKPLAVQYVYYLKTLIFEFDFGPSLKHKERTVNEIIKQHLPESATIGLASILISLWIGLTCVIYSALNVNTIRDYLSMGFIVIGISLPTFVFGPLLQLLFSRKLGWLPVGGLETIAAIILPSVTLALPFAARIARLSRTGMLEVLSEDFILTARAKGLSDSALVFKHAFRGAILPVVSFMGPACAGVLTGTLVVEKIFNIPGLGSEFVDSALNRDYNLVMGTTILYGSAIILFNMCSDIIYALLDPRVKEDA